MSTEYIEQQLEQVARKIFPSSGWPWLSLFLLIIAVISVIAWAFLGTVDVNINGKGVILNRSGLFTIQSQAKGVVKKIFVQPGEQVQKGTQIAEIYDADKEILLKTTEIKIKALAEEVNRLQKQLVVEHYASQKSLSTQLNSLEFDIKILEERLQFLDKDVKKRQTLYKEGLIIKGMVEETERDISDTKIKIEEKKGEIATILFELQKGYRTEELKAKELELLKAKQEADLVRINLKHSAIYSPFEGTVLEILVNPGEVVEEGKGLVNIEFLTNQNEYLIYAYFPSEKGKRIQVGSKVEIALSTVNQKVYGALLGRVLSVSQFAISEKAIVSEIHNKFLAGFLANKQPVIQVIAQPISDARDPSGYVWTSKKGPQIPLSTGTVGEVAATIEKIHPIYYLFPLKEFIVFSYENRQDDNE